MEDIKKKFLAAYDAYAEALYRHCFFRVFSKSRAEELVQEAFMRTWEYLREGKTVNNMKAFLYRTATNLIIDESRKKKEESLEALTSDEENPFEPASRDHKDIEQKAVLREVLSAMQKLVPEHREVLIMRYVDDLDPREIAEILGTNANNISVRLNRAVKELKKLV